MMTITTKTITESSFETFLHQHDEEAWAGTLTTLLRSIHEVDKNATQIWFSFYPLSLFQAFLAAELLIRGVYPLKEQIDSSHRFLYGHRYWPEVKKAVEAFAGSFDAADTTKLSDQILKVARQVAQAGNFDQTLVVGITAIAFMTVQQTGLAAFKNAKGEVLLDHKH